MTVRAPLGPLLRAFFADHLLQQKAVSPQTIHAYRDAFRLLLTFLKQHRQRKPEVLTLDDLDAPVILAFLDHLEEDRANCIASRNARLGAVRSFVRFAALRTPECVDLASRVLAIPRKRTPRRQVAYLTRAEMDAILAGCDRSTHGGRRDHALLLTLYNTGARVSELIAVRHSHVRFGPTAVVQLFGKGRKERAVPLWTRTSRCLRQWFDEEGEAAPDYAFRNARGDRLTRQGVTHLLDQACLRARERCPSLNTKRVSPHASATPPRCTCSRLASTWRPSRCGSATSDSKPPINTSRRTCNSRKTLCENSSRSVNERSGSRPTPRCWPSWRASDYDQQTTCWTPTATVSPTVTCHNAMLVILTETGLWSTARCRGRRRHRQANSVRVCSPTSRRVASLRPRSAGLTALTPAPRTLVQTGSCRRCSRIHPLHVVVDVPSRMTLFRATADTSVSVRVAVSSLSLACSCRLLRVVGRRVVRASHRAPLQVDAVRVVEQAVADGVGLI